MTLRASGDLFLAATAIEEGGEAQAGEVFLRLDVDGEGVDIVVTDPASGSDATAHLAVLGRAREAIDAAMPMLRRLNEA